MPANDYDLILVTQSVGSTQTRDSPISLLKQIVGLVSRRGYACAWLGSCHSTINRAKILPTRSLVPNATRESRWTPTGPIS